MLELLKQYNMYEGSDLKHINPTEIFNEGWMLRFLIQLSIIQEIKFEGVDFGSLKNWTSEGLIDSPFVEKARYKEGYTHADAALGDFDVKYTENGKIKVDPDADFFGIIEAKMGSNLSNGTKHFPKYNQATRNIVCIAHNTIHSKCQSSFWVVAPKDAIKKKKCNIASSLELNNIKNEIVERFGEESIDDQIYIDIINEMSVKAITYESWIEQLSGEEKHEIGKFYEDCLIYNHITGKS